MLSETFLLALAGLVGALFYYVIVNEGKIILPHFDNVGYFYLGIVFNLLVGAVFGILSPNGMMAIIRMILPSLPIVANNYVTAFLAGIVSPLVIEKLVEIFGGKKSEEVNTGSWKL